MGDGLFAPWHIILVAILFVMLFGYKKLPDASKSMARSLRIFKNEMKGFHEDETPTNAATQQTPQLPAAQPDARAQQAVHVTAAPAHPAPDHVASGDHAHHP